jgi:Integrase core domain
MSIPMTRMPVLPSSLVENGSRRATQHLQIRAHGASGKVVRGGHVTSPSSQLTVYRRPARTFVLPVPRVPDGLTICQSRYRPGQTPQAPASYIPDNGICERFHRTVLDEFYRVAFRKKIYPAIDELQADLDVWLADYNERRPHQGRWCFGKTPMQTFLDALPLAKEKSWPLDTDRQLLPA